MTEDPASLELDADTMRAMGTLAVQRVVAHLATLEHQPACGALPFGSPSDGGGVDVAELCRALREGPPEHGAPFDELLGRLIDEWIPRSFNCPGPGYFAFVPGGGLYPAALADLVADATNRYTGVWSAAPLLVQLEANVLEWMRGWMGLPDSARGLLTTGGSMASFGAVVSARERLLGAHLREGVLYVSSQAHHCIVKAARLAGILPDRVRVLEVDAELRLRLDCLAEAIASDRARGLRPFLVVSSAGTVNTGAVDALEDVGALCRCEGLWHHVDGAYGGFFHMCPELRPSLAGLSGADSIALDPHKGLFLPYGTGALLVRDGEALRAAHAATADYLPALPEAEFYDPSQYGPELSRDFRGLRVWLPLKVFGAARFRAALLEKHELAGWAARRLEAMAGISVLAPPALSLFALQLGPPDATTAQRNELTRELVRRVNALNRVMITPALLPLRPGEDEPRYVARICVLCFRTRRRHVEACVDDIHSAARAILP